MSASSVVWPELPWDQVVDKVSKCVFRLYAGNSAGTGFLIGLGRDRRDGAYFAQIATAWHVVESLVGTSEEFRSRFGRSGENVYERGRSYWLLPPGRSSI